MVSEPKTCCGAVRYDYYMRRWYYQSFWIDFCPICGAHLLPTGEVEPRSPVECKECPGFGLMLSHGCLAVRRVRHEEATVESARKPEEGDEWCPRCNSISWAPSVPIDGRVQYLCDDCEYSEWRQAAEPAEE